MSCDEWWVVMIWYWWNGLYISICIYMYTSICIRSLFARTLWRDCQLTWSGFMTPLKCEVNTCIHIHIHIHIHMHIHIHILIHRLPAYLKWVHDSIQVWCKCVYTCTYTYTQNIYTYIYTYTYIYMNIDCQLTWSGSMIQLKCDVCGNDSYTFVRKRFIHVCAETIYPHLCGNDSYTFVRQRFIHICQITWSGCIIQLKCDECGNDHTHL